MVTKKPSTRDGGRAPEDEEQDAARFRIDRVFAAPATKREATVSGSGIPATPPAGAGGRSRTVTRPPIAASPKDDNEIVDLRRQLSRVQRQLADIQGELADKEDALAAEMEKRVAAVRELESVVDTHRVTSTRQDEINTANEARIDVLSERLEGALADVQILERERDEYVKVSAGTKSAVEAFTRDLAAAVAARDVAVRERDEAHQRTAALDASLAATQGQWQAERRELEEEHARELGELEVTHRVTFESAIHAADAQRADVEAARARLEGELALLREATVSATQAMRAGYDEGLATLRAENEAALAAGRIELEGVKSAMSAELASVKAAAAAELEGAKALAAVELAMLRGAHATALAAAQSEAEAGRTTSEAEAAKQRTKLEDELALAKGAAAAERAKSAAELTKLRDAHAAELTQMKAQQAVAQAAAQAEQSASFERMRTEVMAAARAQEEKAKQTLSEAVINNAADQQVMARRHAEELVGAERARGELTRALEAARRDATSRETHWAQVVATHQTKHEATLRELVEANQMCMQRDTEARERGEKLAGVIGELESLRVEVISLRERLDASDARARIDRERVATHLHAGLALIASQSGSATPLVSAPAPAVPAGAEVAAAPPAVAAPAAPAEPVLPAPAPAAAAVVAAVAVAETPEQSPAFADESPSMEMTVGPAVEMDAEEPPPVAPTESRDLHVRFKSD